MGCTPSATPAQSSAGQNSKQEAANIKVSIPAEVSIFVV